MFTRKPSLDGGPSIESLLTASGSPSRTPPPIQAAHPSSSPGAMTSQPSTASKQNSDEEGLVVIGKGTRVRGTIGDCRRLDVYGILEADVVADTLVIREGGGIKGTVRTDNAEIHGVFEGTLIVHEHLDLQNTALVAGEICYRTLSIQTGGKIRGNIVCHEQEIDATSPAVREPTADIISINVPLHNGINGADSSHNAFEPMLGRTATDAMT